jgi:regulator of sigma E protease
VNINVKRSTETPSMVLAVEKPSAPDGLEPMTGIIWDNAKNAASVTLAHPTPGKQLATATTMMVRTIGGLVTPGSDISFQHLSGPVKIFNLYYRLFEQPDGWRLVLWFSVILNVNLALLNLLPFPVLDGGHIVFSLIEMLTFRRIPAQVHETVTLVVGVLLLSFMAFVFYNDVRGLPLFRSMLSQESVVQGAPTNSVRGSSTNR